MIASGVDLNAAPPVAASRCPPVALRAATELPECRARVRRHVSSTPQPRADGAPPALRRSLRVRPRTMACDRPVVRMVLVFRRWSKEIAHQGSPNLPNVLAPSLPVGRRCRRRECHRALHSAPFVFCGGPSACGRNAPSYPVGRSRDRALPPTPLCGRRCVARGVIVLSIRTVLPPR